MRWLIGLATVVVLQGPASVPAQKDRKLSTMHLINGYYWRELDGVGKRIAVDGTRCGIVSFDTSLAGIAARDSNAAKSMKPWDPVDTSTFPDDDIITQITTFYRDSTNMRIPVTAAYLYSVHKLSGEPPEKLEELLARWRKEWQPASF